MAHSSLTDLEGTSNSLIMNERDRLDTADTCACPTAAELSKAVSVSLGLDTVSSPLGSTNQCASSSAFADFDQTLQNSSLRAPELGAARNMNSEGGGLLLHEPTQREDDFGEMCHSIQQVSCMDLLRSGEMDSAQTVTRGPVISTFVCKESNLYMNPLPELSAPSQVEENLPLKPYPAYSANPNPYRDTPGVWCAYSGRSEPESGGSGAHTLLRKYCNCDQASRGSRQQCNCVWYSKGEQGRKSDTRAPMAQGYGQMESYQSAIPQGHATFSTIKTEPAVWVGCADRTFR